MRFEVRGSGLDVEFRVLALEDGEQGKDRGRIADTGLGCKLVIVTIYNTTAPCTMEQLRMATHETSL